MQNGNEESDICRTCDRATSGPGACGVQTAWARVMMQPMSEAVASDYAVAKSDCARHALDWRGEALRLRAELAAVRGSLGSGPPTLEVRYEGRTLHFDLWVNTDRDMDTLLHAITPHVLGAENDLSMITCESFGGNDPTLAAFWASVLWSRRAALAQRQGEAS